MNEHHSQDLKLRITVKQSQTVLPRCLQILSRRGCTLLELSTEDLGNGAVVLHCVISAPPQWRVALPALLEKSVDVKKVVTDE
jgi:acetolactate synthase regulatory subunit